MSLRLIARILCFTFTAQLAAAIVQHESSLIVGFFSACIGAAAALGRED